MDYIIYAVLQKIKSIGNIPNIAGGYQGIREVRIKGIIFSIFSISVMFEFLQCIMYPSVITKQKDELFPWRTKQIQNEKSIPKFKSHK